MGSLTVKRVPVETQENFLRPYTLLIPKFLPRDAMLAPYYPSPCLSVSLSVTSRGSIETTERIELIFGTYGDSFDLSYPTPCYKPKGIQAA